MPDQATHRRQERLDRRRARLRQRVRGMDPVVHDDENAAALRGRVDGDADRVIEVQRAVGADGRRRAHRADQHDGLVALDDEVQEERRLFQSVRAVRDHDAVDVGRRQQLVDALRDLQHDLERHVLRADVRDLLALDVREIRRARNRLQHRVDRHGARAVAGLRAARGGAGDRAARREDDDVRLSGLLCGGLRRDRRGRARPTWTRCR